MKTGTLKSDSSEIRYSFLKNGNDEWSEFYYTITPKHPEPVATQLHTIEQAERELLEKFQIPAEKTAAKRFFSSDIANHYNELALYKNRQPSDFFFSLIEQPPVSNIKLALLGLCLNDITQKTRDRFMLCLDTRSGIRHIFAERITAPDCAPDAGAEVQTTMIFESFQKNLAAMGASVENSVLRTWIYAPHVDADYPGIVKARKEFFDKINLTPATHYIASTGIQGASGERFARVSMDAYAVAGLPPDRVRHIHAPEYLCPTHLYGVTFERATAFNLGNREFLFISGTASIDKTGEIVHPGDVAKQTSRTLDNITALLDAADFSKTDLGSFIVYLRDASDYSMVEPLVSGYAPNLPAIYVRAPVCRPGWLVEIEATAARYI